MSDLSMSDHLLGGSPAQSAQSFYHTTASTSDTSHFSNPLIQSGWKANLFPHDLNTPNKWKKQKNLNCEDQTKQKKETWTDKKGKSLKKKKKKGDGDECVTNAWWLKIKERQVGQGDTICNPSRRGCFVHGQRSPRFVTTQFQNKANKYKQMESIAFKHLVN